MKRIITTAMALALGAGIAQAQDTTQTGVLGQSGDPVYSLQVQGANGVIYNCIPEVKVIDGVRARECIPADRAGLFDAGEGLTDAAAPIAAGVLAIVAIAGGSDGTAATTTTTTTSD